LPAPSTKKSLASYRAWDRYGLVSVLNLLARVTEGEGDDATRLSTKRAWCHRELGDKDRLCVSLIGPHAHAAAKPRRPDLLLRRVFWRAACDSGDPLIRSAPSRDALAQGQPERAAWLFGAGDALREAIGCHWRRMSAPTTTPRSRPPGALGARICRRLHRQAALPSLTPPLPVLLNDDGGGMKDEPADTAVASSFPRPHRPRDRGSAPDRPRTVQPGDRRDAGAQHPHGERHTVNIYAKIGACRPPRRSPSPSADPTNATLLRPRSVIRSSGTCQSRFAARPAGPRKMAERRDGTPPSRP
jgi:hypothetical protein